MEGSEEVKKLYDVFAMEIHAGYINWDKFAQKVFAALELINRKVSVNTDDGETQRALALSDELTLRVMRHGTPYCYKIISPRFKDGDLWCSGFQAGHYDAMGKPVMTSPKVNF